MGTKRSDGDIPGTKALRHRSSLVKDEPATFRLTRKGASCTPTERSFGRKWVTLWAALAAPTLAYGQDSTLPNGTTTLDTIREGVEPATSVLAYPIFVVWSVWQYLMANSAAAILLSAVIAAIGVNRSITHQRRIARVRETFATMNKENWDKDFIEARKKFAETKASLKAEGKYLAQYADEKMDGDETTLSLQSILNNYENIALGIRYGILDEEYLYKWMRSTAIRDWAAFSSMVGAYRERYKVPEIGIEFEGLANAWQSQKSYETGKAMNHTRRHVSVR